MTLEEFGTATEGGGVFQLQNRQRPAVALDGAVTALAGSAGSGAPSSSDGANRSRSDPVGQSSGATDRLGFEEQ